MSKKNNLKEAQPSCHQASEPVVVYGSQTKVNTLKRIFLLSLGVTVIIIFDGQTNLSYFNLSEHAGLCTAGTPLIGASIVAGYARASVEASFNASGREGNV